MSFGNRLKKIRKEKGYTLEELSKIYNDKFNAGLNKGTLSKYENNKQEPMISVVYNLSNILNISIDYLLGLSESENINNELSEDAIRVAKAYDVASKKDKKTIRVILDISEETNNELTSENQAIFNAILAEQKITESEVLQNIDSYTEKSKEIK